MLFIWILFGMIITLDVIVYGLYRILNKRIEENRSNLSLWGFKYESLMYRVEDMDEELKEVTKVKKKKAAMRGRPRKQE